jgi:hypothetical protein
MTWELSTLAYTVSDSVVHRELSYIIHTTPALLVLRIWTHVNNQTLCLSSSSWQNTITPTCEIFCPCKGRPATGNDLYTDRLWLNCYNEECCLREGEAALLPAMHRTTSFKLCIPCTPSTWKAVCTCTSSGLSDPNFYPCACYVFCHDPALFDLFLHCNIISYTAVVHMTLSKISLGDTPASVSTKHVKDRCINFQVSCFCNYRPVSSYFRLD